MSIECNTSSDSQICVGFLVGGSLLVAFLGTAGMTLICLYCRREKVLDGSQSDKEKNKPSPANLFHYPDQLLHLSRPPSPNTFSNYLQNNHIVHLPFNNTVMMSPATESCGDSWDNHIAYINKISEKLHCDLDEKQVSLFTKQTHESESLASINTSNTSTNNTNTNVNDGDKIFCDESVDKNHAAT